MKAFIICNPNSGKSNKQEIVDKFFIILKQHDYEVQVKYTEYVGHAKKIIKELPNDVDLVISLGGDGTFNEVVSGNIKRENKLLLAHIPLGTTNDIGAMFGLGKDPVENLKLLLDGTDKEIDVCTINNEVFVYVAGLGKFTNVAYDTPRKMKAKLGYFAYMVNAFKTFFSQTQLFEMEYEANGEVYKGLYSFVLVCNATRMGGFDVFKDVKLDDDMFEVLMTNITRKKDIVKSLLLVKKVKDAKNIPGVYFFRTNHLKIKLKQLPKNNWCLDGEQLQTATTTYDIKIEKGVKMLIPNKVIDKVFVK